jgi:hypothetical protein
MYIKSFTWDHPKNNIYTNKGEDYRKNCRNWRTCVSENLPTFHT